MSEITEKTLREALVRPKPFIPCTDSRTRNTKAPPWPKPQFSLWSDFTIQTLEDSYGHVLDHVLDEDLTDNLPPTSDLNGITVQDDSGPLRLIGWTDATVMPLVKYGKAHLELHSGVSLQHQYTHADKRHLAKILNAPRKLEVNHTVQLHNVQRDYLVVGLGRSSSKWKSVPVVRHTFSTDTSGKDGPNGEEIWPLRQLANVCRFAKTRYGYIQTDEELVVCRFGATDTLAQRNRDDPAAEADETEDWTNWTAEIMPIPWNTELSKTSSGLPPQILTTELALWWLCMLALSEGHRELVEKRDMVPINAWDTVQSAGGSNWLRRHRYSGYEEIITTPPPAYQTPTPGNEAAFAAGVGINGDPWFDLTNPSAMNMPSAVDMAAFDLGLPVFNNDLLAPSPHYA